MKAFKWIVAALACSAVLLVQVVGAKPENPAVDPAAGASSSASEGASPPQGGTSQAAQPPLQAEQPQGALSPSQETLQEEAVQVTVIDGVILVNKTYALPADYSPGEDAVAAAQLRKMFEAAKKETGRDITVLSGFRSYEYQKQLFNRYVQRDGEELASTYSARPGHSEHQTGLAFDLGGEDSEKLLSAAFSDTEEGGWLAENAHHFGFILRYPDGKTDITGYTYEPWHFRYVGEEHADYIHQHGLTLEEYLLV